MYLRIKLVGLIILLAPVRVAAQGIFEAFGLPKTVVATGQTEVIGSIQLAMRQGPVQADTLIIDVAPYRITNASASDVRLTPAGDITTGTVVIEAADGRVRIPFNAGAT